MSITSDVYLKGGFPLLEAVKDTEKLFLSVGRRCCSHCNSSGYRFPMRTLLVLCASFFVIACDGVSHDDPLPSWVDKPAKAGIVSFVSGVTDPESKSYVSPAERIAVFDNDGTLWAERPNYFQLLMLYEQVEKRAATHPEWQVIQPFKAVLEQDEGLLKNAGFGAMRALSAAVTEGLSVSAYTALSKDFVFNSRHPHSNSSYAAMAYQPMLEFVAYLQENDFKVFIVSGGDVGFIRGFSEPLFGIPKHHVIGSSRDNIVVDDGGDIQRSARFSSMNVGAEKTLNINLHIGRRPIIAVGNSDGDINMMRYASKDNGLVMLLMHDDVDREYNYVEGAEQVISVSEAEGWSVISMKNDFAQVFIASEM